MAQIGSYSRLGWPVLLLRYVVWINGLAKQLPGLGEVINRDRDLPCYESASSCGERQRAVHTLISHRVFFSFPLYDRVVHCTYGTSRELEDNARVESTRPCARTRVFLRWRPVCEHGYAGCTVDLQKKDLSESFERLVYMASMDGRYQLYADQPVIATLQRVMVTHSFGVYSPGIRGSLHSDRFCLYRQPVCLLSLFGQFLEIACGVLASRPARARVAIAVFSVLRQSYFVYIYALLVYTWRPII